ncbi:hypothetical protein [Sediminibacterium ginsengisoli]|uniref:LTXXQ motif family protein n=1 Tax=Sediminibacterium ginsengisoli TaxID=413434 RepID=A0A1T4P3L3_9BACT|nr:hypothetical protein [Sediminibacterium ginsengisoli]SJZ85897.1 hypothetical protein SAMN04488132_105122 [Sediminibacterium ginsengisoli]
MKNKNILRTLLICSLLIAGVNVHAQLQPPANLEAQRAQAMKVMQEKLSLTDKQVEDIQQLTKQYEGKMKSITTTDAASRRQQLEQNQQAYRNGLQQLLSKTQWEQYLLIEKQRREQNMQQRNATMKIQKPIQ